MGDFFETAAIRVRYAETDKMGIVFNANYLSWFEVARTELCRMLGVAYAEWEERGYLLPVAEAYCRYRSPARYDDIVRLLCRAPVESIKPWSIVFEYEARADDGRLLAEGWTKHAFVDTENNIIKRNNRFQEWLVERSAAIGDAK